MSIPSVGPSLPSLNTAAAAAKAAQAAAQNVQKAQANVNAATANLGAQTQPATTAGGTPLAPNTAAAGMLAAGLQSAQPTAGTASKPVPANSGGAMPATQLLPNTAAGQARLDTALASSNSWQSMAAQGQKGANSTGAMARMLQSFSQSTVAPGGGSVSTSSGQSQLIPPGQGGALFTAAQAGGSTVTGQSGTTQTGTPNPANPGTPSPGGQATSAPSPGVPNVAATVENIASQAKAATSAATAGANQPAAGAATLRAEGAQQSSTAVAGNPGKPSLTGTGMGLSDPGISARPEVAARQQVQATQQAVAQQLQSAAAGEGKGVAHQGTGNPRAQSANPDASMVAGVPTPLTPQDPAPKSGQIGIGPNQGTDPVVMSQIAGASGFAAKLQQSLNLNLGIPGLTPANLISALGLLILGLVVLRVFVNGVSSNEVVALSFAAIIGVMLMVAPWATKPRK